VGRIRYIDGLRAISVILVIASHLSNHSSIANDGWLSRLVDPYGTLGVSMFFVISGYVICRSLISEQTANGNTSIAAFFVRRAFRILPPLLVYTATIVWMAWAGLIPSDSGDVTRSLAFICNMPPPISPYCGGYIGAHLWSLSFEEQFYMLFPFVFAPLVRRGQWAILALPILAISAKLADLSSIGHYLHFMSFIAFGAWAAYNERQVRDWCDRLPLWAIAAAIPLAFLTTNLRGGTIGNGVNVLTMPPLLVLVLFGVARLSSVKSALESRALVTVGAASYSIYLWQQLATYAFPGAGFGFYALSITGCIIGALLLFRYVETPLILYGGAVSRSLQEQRKLAADL
jgi:peptidoglycan/LPS O-acetylase OafA/YrhL